MARRKKRRSTVYVLSVAAHLAVGAALALVPQDKLREVVAIALNEAKQEKKAEPPKPPAHAPDRPARAPGRNARAAVPQAAAAAATDAPVFHDIGLALDSSSSDGLAINIAPRPTAPTTPVAAPPPKVLVARRTEFECQDPIVKARPLSIVRPAYTDAARHARVQGRLRIELFVDEHGVVTKARVLEGLGYGLDEAALAAARRLQFHPATRCSRPVAAPFVLGMRFALGT